MTDHRKRRDVSPYRDDQEERSLIQLLSEGKRDQKELKRGIAVMMNKRDEAKEKEQHLLREIESLKHILGSMKTDRDDSIEQLRHEVQVLRALKRETYDDSKEFKAEEMHRSRSVRQFRRTNKKSFRPNRTASVSSVPIYDRKMHSKKTSRNPYDDRPRGAYGTTAMAPVREHDAQNVRAVRNRRRSAPSPHVVGLSGNKVENAVEAFLDIFGQLRQKVMKSLWKRSPNTEERNYGRVLPVARFRGFLHELIVFAFKRDNPGKAAPPPHRTQPLVSLLAHRLMPYVQNTKYLDYEQFKMFPIWLDHRKPVDSPRMDGAIVTNDLDKRKDLKKGSSCYIWSVGGHKWHLGEVLEIKYDDQGEWLVVRYYNNNTWLEKEVQRYSPSLRFAGKRLKYDGRV